VPGREQLTEEEVGDENETLQRRTPNDQFPREESPTGIYHPMGMGYIITINKDRR